MSRKKILILEGSDSIGSALAHKINKKYESILIARNKDHLENLSKKLNCDYYICDVLDTNKLIDIIQDLGDEILDCHTVSEI